MAKVSAQGLEFVKSEGAITPTAISKHIESIAVALHPVQKDLRKITESHPKASMMGDVTQLKFFECLMKNMGAKNIVDVGVFTGCSALSAALSIPENGKVYALDNNEEFVNVGKPFFKQAGVDHKIDVRIGPAIESLDALLAEGLEGKIDFVFVDAIKVEYEEYYERALKLIRKGGIIAFDNMLQGGAVLSPAGNKNAEFCIYLTEKLREDPRVDASLLPIGDGVIFAFKQ